MELKKCLILHVFYLGVSFYKFSVIFHIDKTTNN